MLPEGKGRQELQHEDDEKKKGQKQGPVKEYAGEVRRRQRFQNSLGRILQRGEKKRENNGHDRKKYYEA